MRQKNSWANGRLRWAVLMFVGALGGCQTETETGPPIRQEDAAKIKAGMTLTEIEAILGPAHTASKVQSERLNDFFSKIPEQARAAQSEKGTDRGWGNSQAWLAARISADGHAWLVTTQFGGAPPPQPPDAPKVYFRDMSKPSGGP